MSTLIKFALAIFAIILGVNWLGGGQDDIVHIVDSATADNAQVVAVHQNPALPNTLAGFKRAFANLPAERWGGGDVAVTTVLEDGRAVWFFGDTLTERGGTTWMNRNTSLVQTGETLRAANDGVQIVPSKAGVVYWPVKVKETSPGNLTVWMSKVRVGDKGPWDFKRVRANEVRLASILIDNAGDMIFRGWIGWEQNPTDSSAAPADGSDLRVIEPGHWAYHKITHRDLPLKGGKYLATESQNWDNGHKNTLDYRPMLSAR